ncbi:polysaccharide biosynthesis tyrosine autokinase [Variovorax sp. J22P168]|uniref:polysaccharide biosynthesis tyrosine autokinase n=1 Tax=Variovorax jilinensis TaxID=3053513 RepID=UPI002576058E|nr:polysaccharide biosynthesis tyrosine autokinase [Variovorax sp. J22P168]MDM0012622.1 polysaccharide biosynthesis tyrosine autokinase [Variovorax sp. J22P168]
MNSTLTPQAAQTRPRTQDEDELDFGRYLEVLVANKWLIAAVTLVVFLLGTAYAFLQRPVYEANMVIQVEDPDSARGVGALREAGGLIDVKTPAVAEMEIIRSRLISGQAIDATKLYINAIPNYAPLVGGWMARRATGLSEPGFLGMGGYVTGTEQIQVGQFDVPATLEGARFVVTAKGGGQYTLTSDRLSQALVGVVGTPMKAQTPDGPIELNISALSGKPGAEFNLTRLPTLPTTLGLQSGLTLNERVRQSGIINVTLQDVDPNRARQVLNAIGQQYVLQNVERKSAEAQKSLAFLDAQLPQYKRQMEASEETYNRYRNQKGTVAFTEEANLILAQAVDRQTKLLDAEQRRRELEARFTSSHPLVQTLDSQIAAYKADMAGIQSRIKGLPLIQQEAVRMEREVRVNTELYQSLLNNALQLRLVKEGKVGNVRVLDEAITTPVPVSPNRNVIMAASLVLGLFLGVCAAFLRNAFVEQRIRDPHEVEADLGMPVFSTIPTSPAQEAIAKRRLSGATGVRLLTIEKADDPAVESLRSLRTAMQFAMLEAPNNRVLITGPTPGVGKTFVSSNFAALMAAAGRRTLLIDADLRRGHSHQYFGLQRHGGLSELIAGSLTVQQTVHRQVVPNLDFLATGQLPPNPAELLVSDSFKNHLEKLSDQYDLVVVDAPPVLVAADTSTIATHMGTVLLVGRVDQSTMGELKESTRRLAMGGKAATGMLLNGMNVNRRAYAPYKYGRYRYTSYDYESILPEEQ